MGKVIVQSHTTKYPLQLIGEEAGICWGATTTDLDKNIARGESCLASGHMRTAEYPQIYLILDGYSARVIRELYTHIGGGPTRLQASTRYIDYNNFNVIMPASVKTKDQEYLWNRCINTIKYTYEKLNESGVPKEDIANLLPLGMETKIVLRTNLRNLIDMSHQRLCNRAYWEFRKLMKDIMKALCEYSNEWEIIVKEYFKPKCEVCGFCTEGRSCHKKPTKEEFETIISHGQNALLSPTERKLN